MKILLINQYASNKGDRAVLFALCSLIIECQKDAEVTVSTSNPERWIGYSFYEDHHIKFVPYAWDYGLIPRPSRYWRLLDKFQKYTFTLLREAYLIGIDLSKFLSNPLFYKSAKSSDLIISVGGHHFTTLLSRDIVSSINFDACVAIQQKPLYCFSQSFGPFNFINDRNLKMTKKILNSCELIFPRERNSYKELADFGVSPNKLVMTYESVISLNRLFSTYMPVSYRKKLVGIAIYATQHREKSRYETYVNCMAKFCDYVTTKGFDIQFFPMEMKNSEPDDRPMIRQIIDKVHQKASVHILDEDLSTDEHLKAVAECQLFVGHKTHSTIFALTTGTPLIGIAYHPKTIEFMKQYGLEEYSINDSDLTTDRLSDCFDRILPNLSVIGESCFKKSRMISESIKDDFMQILKQSDRV